MLVNRGILYFDELETGMRQRGLQKPSHLSWCHWLAASLVYPRIPVLFIAVSPCNVFQEVNL